MDTYVYLGTLDADLPSQGGSDCPHECNRLQFTLIWLCNGRMAETQARTPPPPGIIPWLSCFATFGHPRHFANGGIFDDSGCYQYHYLQRLLLATCRQFWADYGLEVAEIKYDEFTPLIDMEFLGLLTDTMNFEYTVGPDKIAGYTDLVTTIVTEASLSQRRRVRLRHVMRLEGQLNFCATAACPAIKGDLSVLRSVTGAGFTLHQHMKANTDSRVKTKFTAMWTTVSQDAAERMLLLVNRIPLCQGAAFAPRHGSLGAGSRHLLWTGQTHHVTTTQKTATNFEAGAASRGSAAHPSSWSYRTG